METDIINRSYLETLSFSDLIKLADEYGIDVPENLDRRFLIGDLLEVAEEDGKKTEEMIVTNSSELDSSITEDLPRNFNETKITCIQRNPVWAFVFWTISESDMSMLKALPSYDLMLRVCTLPSKEEMTPTEAFEIQASRDDFEQYVLIPKGSQFIRIELVFASGATKKILAFSHVMELPQYSPYLNDYTPGKDEDFPEIIKLSGMEKILMDQYKNHGHSFL